MMIQLNLLPDIKLEFIRAQRRKRLMMVMSFLASAAFLAILIALFLFVRVAQKQHLAALDKDIDAHIQTLHETEDLDKILTIQNQLSKLPELHDQKVISSRLFDYLTKLTPNQANISDVELDLEANTLIIKGGADSLSTVNKFVDTIKFTTYEVKINTPAEEGSEGEVTEEVASGEPGEAFSNVVLDEFEISSEEVAVEENNKVTYGIEMSFDPEIFANHGADDSGKLNTVELIVPKIISTRSETGKPKELFVEPQDPEGILGN